VEKSGQEPLSAARKSMTRAEACLWKYGLRAGQIQGYVFKRQIPIMRHTADFLCKQLKLIVEVDGTGHADPKSEKQTVSRQRELEAEGFTVLRFRDEDVLRDMDDVRQKIASAIASLENKDVKEPKPRVRHSLKKFFPDR
jgi:very-short-patch-repair endonuclease